MYLSNVKKWLSYNEPSVIKANERIKIDFIDF